uniref:Uncharacterized protein n=1 Tax=Salix viminalis TaxID=40686 RepID=A0A6N2LNX9_SALVM
MTISECNHGKHCFTSKNDKQPCKGNPTALAFHPINTSLICHTNSHNKFYSYLSRDRILHCGRVAWGFKRLIWFWHYLWLPSLASELLRAERRGS